jgi:hypothetical protein
LSARGEQQARLPSLLVLATVAASIFVSERGIQHMVEGAPLTKKVETCIKQFGRQFWDVSDNYIWYEYDAQFRLLTCLSSKLERDLPYKAPRMVHAHFPARNRQRYDIAILKPQVAKCIVAEDFCSERWHIEMTEHEVASAIEVALAWIDGGSREITWNYEKDIKDALHRLADNRDQLGLDEGNVSYIVICCATKQFDSQKTLADIKLVKRVRDKVGDWVKEILDNHPKGIRVYWASDHPDDSPDWI